MSDDWLDQLRQMHEADKATRQAGAAQTQPQVQPRQAADLLRQSKAHELLRHV